FFRIFVGSSRQHGLEAHATPEPPAWAGSPCHSRVASMGWKPVPHFSLPFLARSRTTPPMRRLFLTDCQAGDVVEDVYVITNKQLAQGANGKHYIKAFLSDRSAQFTARM